LFGDAWPRLGFVAGAVSVCALRFAPPLQESFEHVREWLKEVERYAAPETCKLLIGNKSDRTDRAVSDSEGAALAKELGMPFLETSARTSDNVEAAFIKMAENLIQMRCVLVAGGRRWGRGAWSSLHCAAWRELFNCACLCVPLPVLQRGRGEGDSGQGVAGACTDEEDRLLLSCSVCSSAAAAAVG
jgi:hypothetical protein